jgi:hypothetical protein
MRGALARAQTPGVEEGMRRLASLLVLLVGLPFLALQPAACSGSGPNGERCAVACKAPEGPCGARDVAECEEACNAAVDGLEATCAQCITENTGWEGHTCGADGCAISFGPGDTISGGSGGGCPSCTPTCSGFEIGKVSDSACKAVCLAK